MRVERWEEREIQQFSPEARSELYPKLYNIAKACGFEQHEKLGWVQFPKQETVPENIGPYEIVREHDDGDLTIDSKNLGLAVVTTDGEVFTKPTMPIEIH